LGAFFEGVPSLSIVQVLAGASVFLTDSLLATIDCLAADRPQSIIVFIRKLLQLPNVIGLSDRILSPLTISLAGLRFLVWIHTSPIATFH
jgi:hypothetical protein